MAGKQTVGNELHLSIRDRSPGVPAVFFMKATFSTGTSNDILGLFDFG